MSPAPKTLKNKKFDKFFKKIKQKSDIIKIIKRYKYFLIFSFVLILVSIYNNEFGVYAFKNIKSSLIQMLCVLPPVMILLGLMDEWIPREYFMKYMGDSSKILGILLSFLHSLLLDLCMLDFHLLLFY